MTAELFVDDTPNCRTAEQVLKENGIEFQKYNVQRKPDEFRVLPYLMDDGIRCAGLKTIEVYARVKSRK